MDFHASAFFDPLPEADIQTFCPIRICLGHHLFDGVLDSVAGETCNLYVLTEELLLGERLAEGRALLESAENAEILVNYPDPSTSIPCRVVDCWADEEGLVAYLRLHCDSNNPNIRHQFKEWMAKVW